MCDGHKICFIPDNMEITRRTNSEEKQTYDVVSCAIKIK